MIKYITSEETLPLRSSVLRSGIPLDQCIFPTDHLKDGFHLGYFVEDNLVSIATFFHENCSQIENKGFRLRGMATDPLFSGRGYGTELINFSVMALTSINAAYIWCNARSSAIQFYKKLGFKVISEEFDIQGIGPHFNMIKYLN